MSIHRFCCGAALLLAVSAIAATKPAATRELKHPERVSVPHEIPFTTVSNVRREKDQPVPQVTRAFPAIDFQRGHYEGWQSALLAVRDQGVTAAERPAPTMFAYQTSSAAFIEGAKAGYSACLRVCSDRVNSGEPEQDLRHHCAAAYAPTIAVPPPSAPPSNTVPRSDNSKIRY
jgi:hypothetical protein